MKKIMYSLFFLFCFVFLNNVALAQLNFLENFDYAEGDKLNTHGWVPHSQPDVNPVLISSGSLSYSGYISSGVGNSAHVIGSAALTSLEDLTATFSVDSVSNVYCSFLVNVASVGGQVDYFFHFREDPVAAILRGRVMLKDIGGGQFNFGISKGSTSNIEFDTTARNYGETYLIVLKYEYVDGPDNDLIHLFVNPSISAEEPVTPDATNPDSNNDIVVNAVSLRQGSRDYDVTVDGIRIANSWNDLFTFMSIAQAIEDLNIDFIPDRVGQTVTVEGVIFSPNYQTTNNSFYIYDGTAGTDIFMFGPPVLTWALGDMIKVTGAVTQFNGMTEIEVADTNGWIFKSAGNPTPSPMLITLAQYKSNPEMYEGSLVGFSSLTLVGGTWPASGSTNLSLSDGIDTVVFRIDSDTDIDGQPEPIWPQDVIGIGSQFDNSSPYDGGYQIFPRFYATDFLPAGTIPVELVSFNGKFIDGRVILNWKTSTETNNLGFAVEKSIDGKSFNEIGFVNGNGTTTESKSYSFIDANLGIVSSLFYRLRQIDFNGQFKYSSVVNLEVNRISTFKLLQNYPNPFNPSTTIEYTLQEKVHTKLAILNSLGEEVALLVNETQVQGYHAVDFNAKNLPSGIYFYRIQAGNFVNTKKMILLK